MSKVTPSKLPQLTNNQNFHIPGSGPPYGEKLLQLLYAFNNTLNSLPEDKTKKAKKGAQGAGGHSLLGDGGNKLPVSITTNKSLAGDVHVKVNFFHGIKCILTLSPMGGGQIPPPIYPGKAKNWLGQL